VGSGLERLSVPAEGLSLCLHLADLHLAEALWRVRVCVNVDASYYSSNSFGCSIVATMGFLLVKEAGEILF
jgi:hypothetical protein